MGVETLMGCTGKICGPCGTEDRCPIRVALDAPRREDTMNPRAIDLVFEELRRAEEKFPGFPTDPVHAAAVVAEEAGELVRATLKMTYEGHGLGEVEAEAVQTAAMAIRFLLNSRHMKPRVSPQR